MKVTVLVLILGAVSATAYFSGRIYLLLASHHAQAVEMDLRQREFFGGQATPPTFEHRGLR